MSKFWKWFLGIVLILVVLAILIVPPMLMHFGAGRVVVREGVGPGELNGPSWGRPMMGDEFQFDGQYPMMGGGFQIDGQYPMMGGRRYFSPFLFCFRFLRGLIPLALLGLLVYGAYTYGKRKHMATKPVETTANTAVVETVKPEPATTHNCR